MKKILIILAALLVALGAGLHGDPVNAEGGGQDPVRVCQALGYHTGYKFDNLNSHTFNVPSLNSLGVPQGYEWVYVIAKGSTDEKAYAITPTRSGFQVTSAGLSTPSGNEPKLSHVIVCKDTTPPVTTTTTTTIPVTTTTIPVTTTTIPVTTTTVPVTTTTVPVTTTTAPVTTTTVPVTTTPPTTTIPETTTTTVPETTTTVPETTVPETTVPDSTVPETNTTVTTPPATDYPPTSTDISTPPTVVVPTIPPAQPTPAPAPEITPDELPATGGNSNGALYAGALLLLAGIGAVVIARRQTA
jgi:LPXTG-motif cell wall-anchored protein